MDLKLSRELTGSAERYPPPAGFHISLGQVVFLKMEAQTLRGEAKRGRVCVCVCAEGEQDSDIHALRHGDTDKVSSPPLGQAVIAVGPRFQVATLSGTGIIGSRLGATSRPRSGPAMPLSNSEVWR